MSVPPPTSAPPATAPELVLALEAPRGWRRPRMSDTDRLRLHAAGVSLEHGRVLFAPLELPLGAVKIAAVDPGPARAGADAGRFPVLRSPGARQGDPAQRGDRGLAVDRQRRQRARQPGRGGRGAERRAAVRQAARRRGPARLLRRRLRHRAGRALAARQPDAARRAVPRRRARSTPSGRSAAGASSRSSPTRTCRPPCAGTCPPTCPPTRSCGRPATPPPRRRRSRRPAWPDAAEPLR